MKYLLLNAITFLLTLPAYSQTSEEKAESMIDDSLKAYPNNANWLFLQGMMYAQNKKFGKAIVSLNAAVKYLHQFKIENPTAITVPNDLPLDSCDILQLRAYCYDEMNSISNAVADYRYLQKIKPTDFFYSVTVAKLYIKHKLFGEAKIEVDKIKKQPGNKERGLVAEVFLYYESGRYQQAFVTAEALLKKYPENIEALTSKGKLLVKLNKQKESCQYFEEALSKTTLEYFGGQRGYHREFIREVKSLQALHCK